MSLWRMTRPLTTHWCRSKISAKQIVLRSARPVLLCSTGRQSIGGRQGRQQLTKRLLRPHLPNTSYTRLVTGVRSLGLVKLDMEGVHRLHTYK